MSAASIAITDSMIQDSTIQTFSIDIVLVIMIFFDAAQTFTFAKAAKVKFGSCKDT